MKSYKQFLKEAMNPYKKQTAIDYIYQHTDVSNDKEANAYLMDMMRDGNMDIDDVISYFERG